MNDINLTDTVAVVTGGAQGLGLAIAHRLQQSGSRLSLWDRDADSLAAAASSFADAVDTRVVDVCDVQAVRAAHAATESALGPVAILVNSAGITGPNATVEDYDPAAWRRVIDVNLNGTFNVNQAVIASMKAQDYGRIVNISSVAGKEGNPTLGAYSAAKAGVLGLTKSLGKELAQHNIAVNAVTPATANTKLLETLTPEFIEYMRVRIPRGRFLEVEEAASMVAWLVSAENSFTTAATFDLSGGRTTY